VEQTALAIAHSAPLVRRIERRGGETSPD